MRGAGGGWRGLAARGGAGLVSAIQSCQDSYGRTRSRILGRGDISTLLLSVARGLDPQVEHVHDQIFGLTSPWMHHPAAARFAGPLPGSRGRCQVRGAAARFAGPVGVSRGRGPGLTGPWPGSRAAGASLARPQIRSGELSSAGRRAASCLPRGLVASRMTIPAADIAGSGRSRGSTAIGPAADGRSFAVNGPSSVSRARRPVISVSIHCLLHRLPGNYRCGR